MEAQVSEGGSGTAGYEDEISLLEVASMVLRRRQVIVVSTFVCTMLALVFALQTPFQYTATLSFLPVGTDQGGLSRVSGLAQQFGFSVPRSGGGERSPAFYEGLLKSRKILEGVVESGIEVVTPTGSTFVDLVEHLEIEAKTAGERNALALRHLEGVISVSVGRETGVVTLSVRTDEPFLSAAVARRLLDLISTFDLETRQSQASAERGFAEGRLEQLRRELTTAEDSLESFLDDNRQFANSPQLTFAHDRLQRRVAIRQELFSAMAQAYEQARIDEVRNTPVITVIDQPEPPAFPDARGRLMKVLLGLILGLMLGFALAFIREVGEQAESDQTAAYGEFQKVLADAKRDIFGVGRAKPPQSHAPDPQE
jgi:tyrosine-protein kinase Etk/Wzc